MNLSENNIEVKLEKGNFFILRSSYMDTFSMLLQPLVAPNEVFGEGGGDPVLSGLVLLHVLNHKVYIVIDFLATKMKTEVMDDYTPPLFQSGSGACNFFLILKRKNRDEFLGI